MSTTQSNFDAFLQAYETTALWTSTTDSGEPLYNLFEVRSFTLRARAEMKRDCKAFYKANQSLWADEAGYTSAEAGYDFWLTRNRHGAGFWDRGLVNGKALTEAAYAYGECTLYVHRNRLHIG